MDNQQVPQVTNPQGSTSQFPQNNVTTVTTQPVILASNEPKLDTQPQTALENKITDEEVIAVTQAVNGEYAYSQIELGGFEREKQIENYICENINTLWLQIFNEEVLSVDQQKAEILGYYSMGQHESPMPRRGVRVDLIVNCKNGNKYIVEVKNPRVGQYDTINALGKVLFYSTKFPDANKFVVISTIYEEGFAETVKRYNLPIDFVLFTKDKAFLLKK